MTPTEDREIVELSEFVALRHEERPTGSPQFTPAHPLMGVPGSPLGWWAWSYRTESWEAVDCLQPFFSMRLLKELLVDWIVSIDWSSQLKNYEVVLDSKNSNDSHVGVGGSLELAIAQAWKKAVESK